MIGYSERFRDQGVLVLRIGLGLMFMLHGFPKIMGGPETWVGIGGAMDNLGVSFFPGFWGFMAAFSEFFGGMFLTAGLFTRPASLLMLATMVVASLKHLSGGDGLMGASHAIEAGVVFLSIFIMGPGRLSLDSMISDKIKR